MKKILLIALVVVAFVFAGFYFQIPLKKIVEKTIVESPKIIYEPKIVEREVDRPGTPITLHGIGVYNDSSGDGEIIDIILKVKDGTGKSYFDVTEHFFTEDIQESMQSIRTNVERHTGVNMNTKDIYVHVDLSTSYVGGTSAGAYMGVALVALLENRYMDESALMTGTLDNSGFILPVGNVGKKVKIVQKSQYTKMVVPNLNCNEAMEASIGYGLEIACVSTFSDAINEMLID